MRTLNLVDEGDDVGVALPDDLLRKWQVGLGDYLEVTHIPCGIVLHPLSPARIGAGSKAVTDGSTGSR
jgi:hypothetical protein